MRKKSNNRGFSLIELVVAMAVLAIVGASIYAFVSTSTKSYNNVSQDVDLQEEAQIAMNQLTSILMNAQNAVTYNAEADGTRKLCIYNNDNRYIIEKDSNDSSLYYRLETRKTDDTGAYTNDFVEVADADRALLAEYLDDFNITVDESSSAIVVDIEMDFVKAKRSYTAKEKVTLRNSVRLSGDLNAIYAENTGSTKVTPTYTGIMAQLGTEKFSSARTNALEVVMTDSGNCTLPLSVSIVGNNYPSQSYGTSLTGSSVRDGAELSRVEGGSVVISKDEEASALTLSVVASAWPTLTCNITINIKKISGITIGNNITNPDSAFKLGSEITLGSSAAGSQLYATVSGTGNLSEADKDFQWVAGENCRIEGNKLIITSDESKIGQTFTVIAKSTKSDKTDSFSGTIMARSTNLVLTADSGTLNRGGSVRLTATDGSEVYAQKDVTYSFSVSGGASSDLFTLTSGGTLSAAKELDYNKEYTVTVTAALAYKTDVKQSVTITVPAVALEYALSENGTYSKKVTIPMRNLSTAEGKNAYTVYYRITGIENGKLSNITWKQWGSINEKFADTVAIGSSTITFTKINKSYDGAMYQYDGTYYYLDGTPSIGDVQLSASPITVNNNYGNISVNVKENNGNYVTYNYFIPVEATDGYVTLQGTNVQYRVTSYGSYWVLEFKKTDSITFKHTKYTNYGGGDWYES
jgi:prepilin-type N-terminal cleavage/methylation domain-containing protein